ncbi:MAG: L-2-amino-thiazoline-4-carboxylic acid hydrolase [Atopobiaceae bacterium]|nr:L-2-amino-thiazoline-4-carboxylic acid hydrolase [Atopobiaceae bacterium]
MNDTGTKHGSLTREHTLAEGGPYCDSLIELGE